MRIREREIKSVGACVTYVCEHPCMRLFEENTRHKKAFSVMCI